MKKKTLFVAYASQKGGVGKTTFTVLTASYFHFVLGYNVGIVDCDSPQCNSESMRMRDLNKIREDEYYQRLVIQQQQDLNGKKAYPIMKSSVETGIADAEKMMNSTDVEYDVIFFDLPGTVKTEGVLTILYEMDYLFCPITADRSVLETTLAFAHMLDSMFISPKIGRLRGLYLFWNEVEASVRTILYDVYNEILDEQKIFHLDTTVPRTVRFTREISDNHKKIFRSTFFPADKVAVRITRLDQLFEEMRIILNL